MALERRLARLEAAQVVRPDPGAALAFAALVATLDRLAARKSAGDVTADAELQTLAAMVQRGRA
jgi:hypothetical protein